MLYVYSFYDYYPLVVNVKFITDYKTNYCIVLFVVINVIFRDDRR